MKYAGVIYNDVTAAPGLSVSFYTQGCPHKCYKCQNPQTWDPQGGLEFTADVVDEVIEGLMANNIKRNLCIIGGEPLAPFNEPLTHLLIKRVKEKIPDVLIYIWSGYTYQQLLERNSIQLKEILDSTYCLIDGPYIDELRDVTLDMRGSTNQKIIYLDKSKNI